MKDSCSLHVRRVSSKSVVTTLNYDQKTRTYSISRRVNCSWGAPDSPTLLEPFPEPFPEPSSTHQDKNIGPPEPSGTSETASGQEHRAPGPTGNQRKPWETIGRPRETIGRAEENKRKPEEHHGNHSKSIGNLRNQRNIGITIGNQRKPFETIGKPYENHGGNHWKSIGNHRNSTAQSLTQSPLARKRATQSGYRPTPI